MGSRDLEGKLDSCFPGAEEVPLWGRGGVEAMVGGIMAPKVAMS